ncbi:hypothetical protein [Paractinoplanes rishiriensis]|uniref:Extracellular solute-binding protein n=1 Tax=Paractinoplanes rishiriensis TaxID=1050105 RepID=A0A919MZJ3_9ACTN|nr:hypothetical protein [Actinoplanes rishiriensis]GIE98390.1 hypothetical protein Ari01nite_58550 [Actinoplanes rishiriensis]
MTARCTPLRSTASPPSSYGGTWFSPEFTAATRFYVDLLRNSGQSGAPQSGFTECLNTFSWATSKEYEKLVGEKLGWSRLPSGKRTSTYAIPEYRSSAAAFADITLGSIENANPQNPGVQPRPALDVQFVGIPEFADLGTKVSQEVSAAIAGRTTVEKALANGQAQAETVAKKYK